MIVKALREAGRTSKTRFKNKWCMQRLSSRLAAMCNRANRTCVQRTTSKYNHELLFFCGCYWWGYDSIRTFRIDYISRRFSCAIHCSTQSPIGWPNRLGPQLDHHLVTFALTAIAGVYPGPVHKSDHFSVWAVLRGLRGNNFHSECGMLYVNHLFRC